MIEHFKCKMHIVKILWLCGIAHSLWDTARLIRWLYVEYRQVSTDLHTMSNSLRLWIFLLAALIYTNRRRLLLLLIAKLIFILKQYMQPVTNTNKKTDHLCTKHNWKTAVLHYYCS